MKNGEPTNKFPIEVLFRGFIANSTLLYMIKFEFSPTDERKYIWNVLDQSEKRDQPGFSNCDVIPTKPDAILR